MTPIPTARERIARIIAELRSSEHATPVDPNAVYRTRAVRLYTEAADALESLLSDRAGEGGGEMERAARDIVALWHSPKIEGLPRAERNLAIEDARDRLTKAVKALYGKVRDREIEGAYIEGHFTDRINRGERPPGYGNTEPTPSPTGFTEEEVERAARAFREVTHPPGDSPMGGFSRFATWDECCMALGWREGQHRAMRAALATLVPHPSREGDNDGWIFITDDGLEWSSQHPVESGEHPDARAIRPATAANLLPELRAAQEAHWEAVQSDGRAWADVRRMREAAITSPSREEGLRELREALEPLAAVADIWHESEPDCSQLLDFVEEDHPGLTMADARRARSALRHAGGGE